MSKHKTAKWDAARQTRRERRAADPQVQRRHEEHEARVAAEVARQQVVKAAEQREARKQERIAKAQAKKLVSA